MIDFDYLFVLLALAGVYLMVSGLLLGRMGLPGGTVRQVLYGLAWPGALLVALVRSIVERRRGVV